MEDGEPEDEGVAPLEPEVLMEDIIEYLKLLNYEREFCFDRGLKPLSKCYFSVKSNPSEQFMYFVTLVSWLLSLCGQSTGGWNQHDDPNNVTNNIVLDLNKLDVKIDYPPSKLKAGSGEAVCQALHGLVQVVLRAQKFKFKTPVILNDDDDEGGGDDVEGNADIADIAKNQPEDDDDIAELVDDGGDAKAANFENPDKEIIEAAIDPDEWYRECQRVAHKLKIKETFDAQEWRSHLDQTKKYADAVQQSLPEVKSKVKLSSDEVSRALEKIAKKESMFKTRQVGMSGDYKTQAQQMKDNTEEYTRLTAHVQELESELYDIEEKLADIKKKMDANQDKISDSAPLIRIKKESQKLKNEIRSIDIRVGVISNTLLQLKLKERTKDETSKRAIHNDDDDMDMEI